MAISYTSVAGILEKVNRYKFKGEDHTNEEALIEWVWEALDKIDMKVNLMECEARLDVAEGRTQIPGGLESLIAIRDADTNSPMDDVGTGDFKPLSYKIFNGMILTDFDEGTLLVGYLGKPMDDDGLPLIPDSPSMKKAVESYLMERKGFVALMSGDIQAGVYSLLDRKLQASLVAARSEARKLSPDGMANLAKTMMRPYIDVRRSWH